VELEPELAACVETKAKREYNNTLSELINKGEQEGLAEKFELLRLFLESTDFSQLRNEYEKHLIEGRRVKFILYLISGKPKYEIKII
jgi:hypothetical protein